MLWLKNRWLDYLVYNDDGESIGIRDDTPNDIKKEYEEYLEEEREYKKFVSESYGKE